jgi:putative addiction module killer protein
MSHIWYIMHAGQEYQVKYYVTSSGRCPVRKWLDRLDTKSRHRLEARVLRMMVGNFGDHKAVGQGIWELRMDFGPGYRLYYGIQGRDIILLLCAGDKASQVKDILQARTYWKDCVKMEGGS